MALRTQRLLTILCLALALRLSVCAAFGFEVDARVEVAAALYAASATQAAAEKLADSKLKAQRKTIEKLQQDLRGSVTEALGIRSELAAAQEQYVTEIAQRDRAYSVEIAVFRAAVQDIAATAEGAAALARFNSGDEADALAVLDILRHTRDTAREKRAQIESAAEGRRIAVLALDARTKGKITVNDVLHRFEEVTKLDSGVHSDWVELCRLYQMTGMLAEAKEAATRAQETSNSERDRSASFSELGEVQVKQGDLVAALASYRQALQIEETLAKAAPGNPGLQGDLLISHTQIGYVQSKQGDLAATLASYRQAFAIAETLAKSDPGNTDWQRRLSVTYNRIGDIQVKEGDWAAALASYRQDLAITETLAKRDPGNTDWQRDLSVSYERMGDVQVQQRDWTTALASYRQAFAIAETLTKSDPGNTDWQRDLSSTYNEIGDVQAQQGDLAAALASYRQALQIRETLAKRDPANAGWQRDLSLNYGKIGDVQLKQRDLAAALASYRQVLPIAESLAKRDPGNTDWQRHLIVTLARVGMISGDPSYVNRALTIAESLQNTGKLASADAQMVVTLKNLAVKLTAK